MNEEEIQGFLNHFESVYMDAAGFEMEHATRLLDGFESIARNNFQGELSGNENYFIGGMSPYAFVGNEAGFWDNIKETAANVYRAIVDALKKIVAYFTGDGQKQIDDADKKSGDAIEAMLKLNGDVPVPEGSSVLKKEKYFKEPSVENLSEDELKVIQPCIQSLKAAVDKLDTVKDVRGLVSVLKGIRDAAVEGAKKITDIIKKEASETTTEANKLQNPKTPKDSDPKEVQDAMKKEAQENIASVKRSAAEVNKVASLRNKFLAPALVVAATLSQVEKLKDQKEFKG